MSLQKILQMLFNPMGMGGFGQGGFGQQQGPFENPFGGQQNAGPRPKKPPKPPKGTKGSRLFKSLLITLIFGAIYFYIEIPAINIHAPETYWFVFWLCVVYSISMMILNGFRAETPGEYLAYTKKNLRVPFFIVAAMVVIVAVGVVSGLVIFRTSAYSSLLKTETGDFAQEVAEISFDQIPMLDEDSASRLTNRKLGELSDLVSQFTVSPTTAQINYKGKPVRVTYLNYGNIFKWFANQKEGIPAYMAVDMVTQDVKVVRLEKGIRISPSEYLNRDLDRYLRFHYPTKMFNDVNFEIDEDGTPYWVASVVDKTIGLFNGADVKGAVLLNAVTGESKYYDVSKVPTWVDRVNSASLVIEQYNYYGKYHKGFWNSLFGQSGCTATTSGYNYIAQNDDVWLYTGVTSITGDRGNIGFILVNQRTKESKYYACAGAEETSAMESAQGAVQQYKYTSTFPLLLNISDQPTYFMALKDDSGLVKMYAMVNVQQYQIVATGSTVEDCQENYHTMMMKNKLIENDGSGSSSGETKTISGAIAELRSANMNGDTFYFIRLADGKVYYTINAREYPLAVILNTGDRVTITYTQDEGDILSAQSIAREGEKPVSQNIIPDDQTQETQDVTQGNTQAA